MKGKGNPGLLSGRVGRWLAPSASRGRASVGGTSGGNRPFRPRIRFATFATVLLGISLVGLWPGYFLFQAWQHHSKTKYEAKLKADYGPEENLTPPLVTPIICQRLLRPPLICAHGGDTSEAPPNTVAAYKLAIKAKVDCIEVDASRTADNVLVALHDRDLQTFTGRADVRVGDMTYHELRGVDAGRTWGSQFAGQRVMTLEQALKMTSRHVRQVTVDVKVGPPLYQKGLAADTLSVIKKARCQNCLVWAKEDEIVADVKNLHAPTRAGYIVMREQATGEVRKLLRMEEPEVVGVYFGLADGNLVAEAHKGGKEVHAWTVNDKEGMHNMLAEGVDAIITNHPRKLRAAIEMHRRFCEEKNYL